MSDKQRQPKIVYILAALMLLALIFVGYTSYQVVTLKPGEKQITTTGTIAKPSNNVKDASITDDGYLLLRYEDGTERRVGNIVGLQGVQGSDGRSPSQTEIALAVLNYCADGRCDAKNPSTEQVATAVYNYCSTGLCKGDKGVDGLNVTADQVMAAVSQYCSDGRCSGPQGASGTPGTNGINGRTTLMACVIRTTNNVATQYVAWRYEDEENTAYRNLYKLPVWAQGSDCVDLRTT